MNPLFLIPISVCILSSCTLSEFQAKTPSSTQSPPIIQQTENQKSLTISQATDPTVITPLLRDAYSEERLAEDVYTLMVEKYPQFTEVTNIIDSEEKHSEQVGRLLDARGIARPTDYGSYSGTYEVLKKMIDTSLTQAIEA